jgi:tetratricopeptide (TPR) repeat protein
MCQCTGLLCLLALLSGLTAEAQQPILDKALFPLPTPDGPQQRLAEDIEVLRRILNRSVDSLLEPGPSDYRLRWSTQQLPAGWHSTYAYPDQKLPNFARLIDLTADRAYRVDGASGTPASAEGVYLKGRGIVYTMTLPAELFRSPPREPAQPPAKPLSDWERTRKEVRGEKVTAAANEAPQPTLREVILKTLAENGRHLQLADTEEVTVVVTLRPTASENLRSDATGDKEFVRRAILDILGREPTQREVESFEDTPDARAKLLEKLLKDNAPKIQVGQVVWQDFLNKANPANEQSLLGDLHLKQNRYPEAIKAFTAALKENPPAKEAALLYRKLAQTQLAAGDLKAAEAALTKAQQLQDEAAKAGPATSAAPTRPILPGKLVVSAPKKLLDQVGAGKITFEEFRKSATVDYQTFTAEPKKQP